jgi:excisionase family DNA binding protein
MTDTDRLLTVTDVAQLLGVNPQTVRGWCRTRRFEHIRLGTSIRFSRGQVERLLAELTVPAERREVSGDMPPIRVATLVRRGA